MTNQLTGKVAVVSGGGGGMMRDIAARFAAEGARVVLADSDADRATAAAADFPEGTALPFHGDLASEETVQRLVRFAVERFGSVDIGVNTVGARANVPLLDETGATFARTLQEHLTGTFLAIKYQALQMIAQGRGGTIITVSSIGGLHAMEGFAAYGSAKAGVIHLTKMAALELGPHGIRVNSIAPGTFYPETEHPTPEMLEDQEHPLIRSTPLRRLGRGNDLANLALFLASEQSSWISGQIISADGGASVSRYPSIVEILQSPWGIANYGGPPATAD